MATITFVNNGPIAGLAFNPGLEDVLDPAGIVTFLDSALVDTVTITNNTGGPFHGFKFELTGAGFNAAGTAGTIGSIRIKAPDGMIIATVDGPFGDTDMADFYGRLTTPNQGIISALNGLLNGNDTMEGSEIADHLMAFGGGVDRLFGRGGDDVLLSPGSYSREVVGGTGSDTIRVEDGTYKVHGGNTDGSGGEGTDALEIVGYVDAGSNVDFGEITNIDVLRFVAGDQPVGSLLDGASVSASINLKHIGAGLLSPTLAVEGSTTASPLSENAITIFANYDETATAGVTLDLSGWTFTNWSEQNNEVFIYMNSAPLALSDTVVGTIVAESVETNYGDDSLRGGGGADSLHGGQGNDTFLYGLNEAVKGEYVAGGNYEVGDIDTLLVLADNDFSGVGVYGIDRLAFGGAATATFDQNFIVNEAVTVIGDGNTNALAFQLNNSSAPGDLVGTGTLGIDLSTLVFQSWTAGSDLVTIRGSGGRDAISGSMQNDVMAGGDGKDDLQGNAGADLFDTAFGKGVDHIVDFNRKEGDFIQLDDAIFAGLKLGDLKKKAFATGTRAEDKKDRLIYDKEDGVLRYDDDGSGKHKAYIVAILDDASSLKFGDILVI